MVHLDLLTLYWIFVDQYIVSETVSQFITSRTQGGPNSRNIFQSVLAQISKMANSQIQIRREKAIYKVNELTNFLVFFF